MNIILMGYRASGKTSVGRLLAQSLGMSFKDIDIETCKAFGNNSIADIWQQHGEPAWRAQETLATQSLCVQDHLVIALGGGTLMQAGARLAVEEAHAWRVYLQCDPPELDRRISSDARSAQTRPSLTAAGGNLAEIKAVLAIREPVYLAVADQVVNVTSLSMPQVAQAILDHPHNRLHRPPTA